MRIVYVTMMFLAIEVERIFDEAKEFQVTNETFVLFLFSLEIMPTLGQVGVLCCFIGAKYLAFLALPRLIDSLVVRLTYLLCFLVSHHLSNVLLHRERDHLYRSSCLSVNRRAQVTNCYNIRGCASTAIIQTKSCDG